MVVLMLLALILPTAYSTVSTLQHQVSITSDRFQALSEAQVIADRITKDLRTGVSIGVGQPPFKSAGPADIQWYASLGDPNGPTLLHAYVQPLTGNPTVNAFHEDFIKVDGPVPPAAVWAWTGANNARLDGDYVDTTVPTIFTYFDVNNAPIALVGGVIPGPMLISIDSIGITLTTRIRPNAPATTITTLVHIRGVDYDPKGG